MKDEELDILCRQAEDHEGFRATPYRCTAYKLTIGIGYNIQDRGLADLERAIGRPFTGRLTYDEARAVVRADIRAIAAELTRRKPVFAELDVVRQRALIDMGFMGVPRLMGFVKMWAALERRDYPQAAAEALDSKWARDVGPRRSGRVVAMLRTGRERG